MKNSETKTIAIIDGNSLMHRAFHAVPAAMTAPDGTPTNAAFGFMSMLIKFIDVAKPDAIICAFDRGRPAFRMEALKQYKAQRPPMDPSLKVQFPLIEDLLRAMDIPVVTLDGWEGDDILGTISAQNEAKGYASLLVTGDKDAYQLASSLTRIATTKKGISDVALYGPAEVVERYGVAPVQVPDFLGLKGDSSDNIPGVPGIGEKRASALIQQYGSLEGIYDNLDKIKGKQHESLANNKESAFISRKVATIVRDLDIQVDLDNITFPSFDPQVVTDAFTKVRFMSHLNKVLGFSDGSLLKEAEATFANIDKVFEGEKAQEMLEKALAQAAEQFGTLETDPSEALSVEQFEQASEISHIGVAWGTNAQTSLFESGLILAVYTSEGTALFEENDVHAAVVRLLSCPFAAAFDVKKLIQLVLPADNSKKAFIGAEDALAVQIFDVALAHYVLHSSQASYDLRQMYELHCGSLLPEDTDNIKQTLAYKAAAIASLAQCLRGKLAHPDEKTPADSKKPDKQPALSVAKVYANIDYPLVSVLALMERVGAKIDRVALARISATTEENITQLKSRIIELAGEDFNVDSPKQLGHILFDVLGLPPQKKNQRGYSTDASVLKELAKTYEIAGLVLHYREYAKIKSTYLDALPKMEADDGRIHTSFNEMVTATGRLSSSDPNLQNIPVRTEFGHHIRECFIPLETGQYFLSCDYSQIELRLLAHLSGDEHLIHAFSSGADFHAQTAARVFGVPVEDVTPQLRSRAKAVNFGIVYGQQAFGLSKSLDISFAEAKAMIDKYFEAYPQVRHYLDEVVAQAQAQGYVSTMFGRRRYIPELRAANQHQRSFGKRTAMNHPMQGSAADIIKLAMRQVQTELVQGGYKAKLMLQVHDELDFSVPQDEAESLSAKVVEIMEQVVSLKVPLVVDATYGDNWGEAH